MRDRNDTGSSPAAGRNDTHCFHRWGQTLCQLVCQGIWTQRQQSRSIQLRKGRHARSLSNSLQRGVSYLRDANCQEASSASTTTLAGVGFSSKSGVYKPALYYFNQHRHRQNPSKSITSHSVTVKTHEYCHEQKYKQKKSIPFPRFMCVVTDDTVSWLLYHTCWCFIIHV